MSVLRAELRGTVATPVPQYRMLLPLGWQSYDVTADTQREFLPAADRTRVEALDAAVVRAGEDWPL